MAKGPGSREDLYNTEKGILGNEEFVDETIHRLGETGFVPKPTDGRLKTIFVDFQTEFLLGAVEQIPEYLATIFATAANRRDPSQQKNLSRSPAVRLPSQIPNSFVVIRD
ncbi:MAG: hypothetical protein ABIV48_13635 [Pyrinomonadaceae bacterium]